jgi:hypothetical protein
MKKALFATLTLSLLVSTAFAQTANDKTDMKLPHQNKRYTVAWQPLFLFNNALRLDFETRIKDKPAWLQISPAIYLVKKKNRYMSPYGYAHDDYYLSLSGDHLRHMFGASLEVSYKYFFTRKESFYLSGGGSYAHHDIHYDGYQWESYMEDGLQYLRRKHGDINQKINKLGLNALVGYQIPNSGYFLFDMFLGAGYRKSFRSNPDARTYDSDIIAYGYTGFSFITGIRFGVKF